MNYKKVMFLLCFYSIACALSQEIMDRAKRHCESNCELKNHMEELFRMQLHKLDNQRQKFDEFNQKISKVSDLQTTLMKTIRKIEEEIYLNLTSAIENISSKQQKQQKQLQNIENMSYSTSQFLYKGCPISNGYVFNPEIKICYKIFSPTQATTTELKRNCSKDGAELLKVQSQDIQNYFANELGKIQESFLYVLIQGNDVASEGTWVYDDGSPLTYFNWNTAEGQPDGSTNQNVLVMNPSGHFKWHDIQGTAEKYVCVCQIIVE